MNLFVSLFPSDHLFFIDFSSPRPLSCADTYYFLFSVSDFIHSSYLCFTLQVAGSLGNAETGLKQHLQRLDEIFATRADYLQTLRFMRLMINNVIRELTALPDISKANVDLAAIADQTAFIEYYR